MERILGAEIELSHIEDRIVENFETVFGLRAVFADKAVAELTI